MCEVKNGITASEIPIGVPIVIVASHPSRSMPTTYDVRVCCEPCDPETERRGGFHPGDGRAA